MKDTKKSKQADMVRERPLTYDDYAKLPDDGMRFELADGVLEAMSPGPNAKHQLVSQEIADRIKQTCSNEFVVFLSPIDVILSIKEVRQPDVVLLRRDRLTLVTKRGIEGPPNLVIEVLSPHSIKRDRQEKLKTYAHYQIPEYWIVDFNSETLEQYVLNDHQYDLLEVYFDDAPIHSQHIPCVSFTMNEVISSLPELPNF